LNALSVLKIGAITFLLALLLVFIVILLLSPYMKKSNFSIKNNEVQFMIETTNK
jgi:cell division septal protein FtsQ